MRLSEMTGIEPRKDALRDYKGMLYYRGNVRSKPNQFRIPDHVVKQEEALGFAERGVYTKRLRYFVDGIIVGGDDYIRNRLTKLRATGQYVRRKNPVIQENGIDRVLRPQRATEIPF